MLVHFGWHHDADSVAGGRSYAYNVWNTGKNALQINFTRLTTDQSGYVAMAVTPDNKVVIGGHQDDGVGNVSTHIYWDYGPGVSYFTNSSRIPPAVYAAGMVDKSELAEAIWPSIDYHEVGGVGYTYTMSHESPNADNYSNHTMCFFRKVGIDQAGTWTASYVDTNFTLSGVVVASQISGKIALGWCANRPEDGDCDTCSSNDGVTELGGGYDQHDNDIYYKINENCGTGGFGTAYDGTANFWRPRVNVTKYDNNVDGYRAYGDISLLLDEDDDLHVAWPGGVWTAGTGDSDNDGGIPYANRIFHYSEDVPNIRTVHNATWGQEMCNGGAWSMNAHLPMLSECEDKLYCVFVQYNDIPNGVIDDCAYWGYEGEGGDPTGSANADIWVSVSSDEGMTWDVARNLTNSYTPHCGRDLTDPEQWQPAGACEADNWVSVTKTGTDFAGPFPAATQPTPQGGTRAFVVDPSGGSSSSNSYMDVQYILDSEAGGSVQEEGNWTFGDVMWFRLRCVDPVSAPVMNISLGSVGWPLWTHHGDTYDTVLYVENSGNAALAYTVAKYENTGDAYTGWLQYSGNSGNILAGLYNIDTVEINLNDNGSGGAVVNNPGTIVHLGGGLIFTQTSDGSKDTTTIDIWVADTVETPTWDTVYVDDAGKGAILALTAGSNGDFGNQGKGNVNLDYFVYGDCDNDADLPIEGDASIYLYDGSPIIGWIDGTDTMMYWSCFGNGFLSENTLYPIEGNLKCAGDDFEAYYSGIFVTGDSSIAMGMWTIAPKNATSTFVVQKLKIWSYDGAAHNGLTIGEAIDWDIPSDTASYNNDGSSPFNQLIYLQGLDLAYAPHTDDSMFCQNNANRFGGLAFVNKTLNGTVDGTSAYGAYCAENDVFIYNNDNGFEIGELWTNMQNSGFTLSDSTEDLHMVMTYGVGVNLGATDVLTYTTVLATIENGVKADLEAAVAAGKAWITAQGTALNDDNNDGELNGCATGCCVDFSGNVNGDALDKVNVVDLTYLVGFLFGGGPAPLCKEEGNVNGDVLAKINVVDLTYLVGFLFGGGPQPPLCLPPL
jgi:hypothetical protein